MTRRLGRRNRRGAEPPAISPWRVASRLGAELSGAPHLIMMARVDGPEAARARSPSIMIDLLFGPQTIWFGVPALIGTLFFVLRLAMVAAGIDLGDGADGDAGVAMDAGVDDGLD